MECDRADYDLAFIDLKNQFRSLCYVCRIKIFVYLWPVHSHQTFDRDWYDGVYDAITIGRFIKYDIQFHWTRKMILNMIKKNSWIIQKRKEGNRILTILLCIKGYFLGYTISEYWSISSHGIDILLQLWILEYLDYHINTMISF